MYSASARETNVDCLRVAARRDHKIVFQLALIAVIDQIDPWVHFPIADLAIVHYIRPPIARIFSEEIVCRARQLIRAGDLRILISADQMHSQHSVGVCRFLTRAGEIAEAGHRKSSALTGLSLATAGGEGQYGFILGEENGVARTAGKKFHSRISLARVGFKAERKLAVGLENPALIHRRGLACGGRASRGREDGCSRINTSD